MFNRLKTRNLIAGAAITALIAGGLMALPLGASAHAQAGYLHHGVHAGGGYQAQEVQYRRGWHRHRGYSRHPGWHRHHRYHRRDRGAAAAAGIIGLATGAIIGSALSQPRVYHYPEPPRVYGGPPPTSGYYYAPPRSRLAPYHYEEDSLPLTPRY